MELPIGAHRTMAPDNNFASKSGTFMSITISSAFDAGNIRVVENRGDTIDLEIVKDHMSDFHQWFHFRLAGGGGSGPHE